MDGVIIRVISAAAVEIPQAGKAAHTGERRAKKVKTHSFYTDCSVSAMCACYNGCTKNERAVKCVYMEHY